MLLMLMLLVFVRCWCGRYRRGMHTSRPPRMLVRGREGRVDPCEAHGATI
ncbi:unnamed protein product [Mesocestoides corti]|uniref:Uncharacterized protein n=1 Tax=Mesocestoides corti TaxID=53468 RepID=A0A3P6GXM7_MESCO|nr:unnamed protein product [Mesocestoides corti]